MSAPVERSLPASEEAENHVIGCGLLDEGATVARAIGAGVDGECFHTARNRLVWSIMVELWATNAPATLDTLMTELVSRKQLEAVGGFEQLMNFSRMAPTTVHAGYFIEKVIEKRRLRDVIRMGTSAVEQAYAFTEDMDELMANISNEFNRAVRSGAKVEDKFQSVAAGLAEEADNYANTGILPKREVVPWGLVDLDKACRPMEAGELVVLGGRPSTGKSALADQVAWRTACLHGNVLLFTYEMTKREKAIRISQQITGLNYNGLDALPKDRAREFSKAFLKIRDCPNLHVFERDVSAARVVARCRTFAAQNPVRLIVVDFLQYLARLEPTIGKERTDEKIGRLTASLKDVARECKCPVLMLASLNREGEKENRPPRMSDLRASGEIESDADVIALLHWPTKTPRGEQQDPHDAGNENFYVEFNQEKGRNKGVHQVGLQFNRPATRFQNLILP